MFEFASLLFGLSSAPRVFTKLMTPVVSQVRKQNIHQIVYLDDMLIMAEREALASNSLQSSGSPRFHDKPSKIQFFPIKQDGIFGFFDRLPDFDFCSSPGQGPKSKERMPEILDMQRVAVRDLARVLGHLTLTIQAVFPTSLHLSH